MTAGGVDLQHMAEVHILYEVKHLCYFERFLILPVAIAHPVPTVAREMAGWIHDSQLEAGLIHLRNVAQFIVGKLPTTPKHDDVVAAHYRPHWTKKPEHVFGADRNEHDDFIDEIHKRVAHITARRSSVQDDGDFEWNEHLRGQIPVALRAFRAFMDCLPPPERGWFDACGDELRKVGM